MIHGVSRRKSNLRKRVAWQDVLLGRLTRWVLFLELYSSKITMVVVILFFIHSLASQDDGMALQDVVRKNLGKE